MLFKIYGVNTVMKVFMLENKFYHSLRSGICFAMPIKRILHTVIPLFVLSAILISCATQQHARQTEPHKQPESKPILIEHPERFFWEIKGSSGSVYILGTIHIADQSFYPLEKKVLRAFDRADRLVSELGGQPEIEAFLEKLQEFLVTQTHNDPHKNLLNILSETELAFLYELIGDDSVHRLALCNPWLLNTVLTQFLFYKIGFDVQSGIDMHLIARAKDKTILPLDTADEQLAVLSYGTFEDQLAILKDTIYSLQNINESSEKLYKLRELYLTNNRKELTALLTDMLMEVPASFSEKQIQQYTDALLTNRNRIWAQKCAEYVQAGGTTFIFAGVAHFLGDSSVFSIMRQQGTLE